MNFPQKRCLSVIHLDTTVCLGLSIGPQDAKGVLVSFLVPKGALHYDTQASTLKRGDVHMTFVDVLCCFMVREESVGRCCFLSLFVSKGRDICLTRGKKHWRGQNFGHSKRLAETSPELNKQQPKISKNPIFVAILCATSSGPRHVGPVWLPVTTFVGKRCDILWGVPFPPAM